MEDKFVKELGDYLEIRDGSTRILNTIQYNTIQILLSTPHRGFSETKKYSKVIDKQLLRNNLHIKFMTFKIDLKEGFHFTFKK